MIQKIYSTISKKGLLVREMREELQKRGIKHSFKFIQSIRNVGIRFGLLEKKYPIWTKEKLEEIIREEAFKAQRSGKRLRRGDLPVRIQLAITKYYGNFSNACRAARVFPFQLDRESLLELIKREGTPIPIRKLREKPEIRIYQLPVLRNALRDLEQEGKIRILKISPNNRIIYFPGEEEKAIKLDQEERVKNIERLISSLSFGQRTYLVLLEKARSGCAFSENEIPNYMRKFVAYISEHSYSFMKKKLGDVTYYSTNYKSLKELGKLTFSHFA